MLIVGDGFNPGNLPRNCRYLDRPGMGYYGFKNEGAREARGKYVVFWDSDCKISRGYLRLLLDLYSQNPGVIAIGGRTDYDNPHLWSRVNTIVCFGHFCRAPQRLTKISAITNNVSIRKTAFPRHPFGPHTGRTGGDTFITQYAARKGAPILFDKRLFVLHEDITTHTSALLERLLRDLFHKVNWMRTGSKWEALARGYWNWPILSLKRLRRVLIYRKDYRVEWHEMPGALAALAWFTFLEIIALICMTFRPSLLMKWLNFQFGSRWIESRGIR